MNNKKIKVLRIINRFNVGGPIYNVTYLTKYLPDEYETILVGGNPIPSEKDGEYILKASGVEAIKLSSLSRKVNLINDVRALLALVKLIKKERPDIVHTHASKAGFLGRIAARLMGVKVIIHTYHGHVFNGYFNNFKSKLIVIVERLLGKITTKIIAISDQQHVELTQHYKIAKPDKVAIIPLGFNLDPFLNNEGLRKVNRTIHGLHDDCIAVGIVGRLTAIKNHKLFIDGAVKALESNAKTFQFFIVGDGELMEELQRYLTSLPSNVQSTFTFTSWIEDMAGFYAAMDLVCLTSLNEGTPVTLIEAQASGVPVISTNVGGVRDIVLDKETGILLNEQAHEAFAENLLTLGLNEHLRLKMSQNARNFVKHRFSYHRLVEDMNQLYKLELAHD